MTTFEEKLQVLYHCDESDLISSCYDFVNGVEKEYGYQFKFVEPLLLLIEQRADDDFGSPGPLVHYIEQIEGYESELLRSLNRQPVFLTVFMAQRIINSEESNQGVFINELKRIESDVRTGSYIKDLIQDFLN